VEDACGAGVSVAELNSTEYLGLFSDTMGLLNSNETIGLLNSYLTRSNNDTGSMFAAVITEEEIENTCEVRDEA